MDIKKKNQFYLTPFLCWGLVFLLGCSCGPTELPRINLEFEIPVSIYPNKPIYEIGDTLNLEIIFNKELIDLTGEYRFSFENFDFDGAFRFLKLIDKGLDFASQPGAMGSVQVLNKIGKIEIASNSGAVLHYDFDGNTYSLKAKFVIQKPGVYSFVFFTVNDIYDSKFKKNIEIPGIIANIKNIYYTINEGENRNIHLINENTINDWDPNEETNNRIKSYFSFKVLD